VRTAWVAAGLGAAALTAGCGSGSGPPDDEQIRSTLTTYYQAFASGDGATACDQLSEDSVATLEKQGRGRTCPQVLDAALRRPGYASVAQKLTRAKIAKITVADGKATVSIEVPGAPAAARRVPVLLKKEGVRWKITSAPR
jgi:ketosteroid isomerase-like protein